MKRRVGRISLPLSVLLVGMTAMGADTGGMKASGGPQYVVPGKNGQALKLDGKTYVKGPRLGMLEQATILMWVKVEDVPWDFAALLNTTGWQQSGLHVQLVRDGRLRVSVNGIGADIESKAEPAKVRDAWQHIAVSYDGKGKAATIYINGKVDASVQLDTAVPLDLTKFTVGAWDEGARPFVGLLEDVRIYSRVLSGEEIARAMEKKAVSGGDLMIWDFAAVKARTVVDISGNKRNGRIAGESAGFASPGPEFVKKEFRKMGLSSIERGFVSGAPAPTWEHALLSGNGIMGAMVMSEPLEETIILNHAGLFRPIASPKPPVDTGSHLKEIRQMMADGQYQKAADYVVELSREEGWRGKVWTDPFVPACDIAVAMPEAGEVRSYLRGVDFSTGVAAVRWEDDRGEMNRRVFVSRADNLVVLWIKGSSKGKLDCDIKMNEHAPVGRGVRDVSATAEGEWLTYRHGFALQFPGSLQGCEAAARVVARNGTAKAENGAIRVRGADEVLVLVRVDLTRDFAKPGIEGIKRAISAVKADYNALLERHAKVHGGIFNRERLDLGGAEDHALTAEELIAKSRVGALSRALLEKEFDACRYNILSSMGAMPPLLQGIWTGTWSPAWSGDYTQNGNVQSAIASVLSGNMAECMDAYFRYLESQLPEYRVNAQRLYGARGIHVPSRTSSHGLNNHFDQVWPMTFWTAGAGWAAHFFHDYYLYTGDREFLRKRAVPFMKEAALFYEDFLFEGPDGKYVFSPSYSPENNPANNPSQSCVNAAMDIAVARELLTNLVAACEELKVEEEGVGRWKAMLAKLPDYMINKDGAVKEWNVANLDDNYGHRHCSHLYALFDGMPKEIAGNEQLKRAFMRASELRMEVRRRNSGGEMAFGLVQLGLAVSSLRDAEMSYEIVDWLANNYWFANMATTHNPKSIFNTDLSGGLPAIIIKMLAFSDIPGTLDLLPACPKEWPKGRIEGIACRGAILVRSMSWDGGKVTVTLRSKNARKVAVRLPWAVSAMKVAPGGALVGDPTDQGRGRLVSLPAGEDVTLEIAR